MKNIYEKPTIEVLTFEAEDITCSSIPGDPGNIPVIGGDELE